MKKTYKIFEFVFEMYSNDLDLLYDNAEDFCVKAFNVDYGFYDWKETEEAIEAMEKNIDNVTLEVDDDDDGYLLVFIPPENEEAVITFYNLILNQNLVVPQL